MTLTENLTLQLEPKYTLFCTSNIQTLLFLLSDCFGTLSCTLLLLLLQEAQRKAEKEEEERQKARAYDPANWNGTNTRQWQALDYSSNSYNQEVHPLCKSSSRSLRTIVVPDPKTAPDPIPAEPAYEQPEQQETADEASSDDQRMQKRPGEITSITSVTESTRSSAAGCDSFTKSPEQLRKISKSAGSLSQLRVNSKLVDQLAEQSEVAC
jgi:hypothetical protein